MSYLHLLNKFWLWQTKRGSLMLGDTTWGDLDCSLVVLALVLSCKHTPVWCLLALAPGLVFTVIGFMCRHMLLITMLLI